MSLTEKMVAFIKRTNGKTQTIMSKTTDTIHRNLIGSESEEIVLTQIVLKSQSDVDQISELLKNIKLTFKK